MIVEGLVVGIITLAALCGAVVVPVEEADIQLTASDADTGNWTANMGEIEINIEHEHNSGPNENGTWTLKMARTLYDQKDATEENTSQQKKDESSQNIETTYIPTPFVEDYNPPEEEQSRHGNDIALGDMSNSIPLDEAPLKDSYISDSYSSDYPNFIPQQVYPLADMYRMFSSQQQRIHILPMRPYVPHVDIHSDENLDSDEVILDPDNFEYFKGVGWFKLDDRKMSWENARDACSAIGAHLAAPDTEDRVRVFLKLFQRHPEIPRTAVLRAQVYVGVNDPLKNRVFTTVQGNIFNPDFPIWFTNEPDNAAPGEDCVTFHMEGRTRDVPCFYHLPFFCEKDLPVVI